MPNDYGGLVGETGLVDRHARQTDSGIKPHCIRYFHAPCKGSRFLCSHVKSTHWLIILKRQIYGIASLCIGEAQANRTRLASWRLIAERQTALAQMAQKLHHLHKHQIPVNKERFRRMQPARAARTASRHHQTDGCVFWQGSDGTVASTSSAV